MRLSFRKAVEQLEDHYGPPSPPVTRDPFELILYENIAYLVSDDRREKAFRELKKRVGLRPADVLTAPLEQLAEITALGGIFPELRARRLQESARMVRDEFGGNLRRALALDPAQARKALRKFPVIGEPGADKILLFTGTVPTPRARVQRPARAGAARLRPGTQELRDHVPRGADRVPRGVRKGMRVFNRRASVAQAARPGTMPAVGAAVRGVPAAENLPLCEWPELVYFLGESSAEPTAENSS